MIRMYVLAVKSIAVFEGACPVEQKQNLEENASVLPIYPAHNEVTAHYFQFSQVKYHSAPS